MSTITHKRGDTFGYSVVLPDTSAVDNTWSGRSQARNEFDTLVATFTFTWLDTKTFEITAADTTGWEVGTLQYDVEFVSPAGVIQSTDIGKINVVKDITRD